MKGMFLMKRIITILLVVLTLVCSMSFALAEGETPAPTAEPTATPTITPTAVPTVTSTVEPTVTPTAAPTTQPSTPSPSPTASVSDTPSFGKVIGTSRIELSKWFGNDQSRGEIPAPSGKRDEKVEIYLPLVALEGPLTDLEIEPVLSTNLDSFPFVIPSMVMTQERATLSKGNCWEVCYDNLVLSHSVTKGLKQVDFKVRYTYNGVREEITLSIFVNVTKGASTGGGGGVSFRSQPKLIVERYDIDTDKIYAGEPFTLTMDLRNTSSDEAIKNIQLQMKEATGIVLPAENGSNALYIKQIDKEGLATVSVKLQSAPDAEAKAYALALAFSYDGVSSKQAYTAEESITLPVQQRIRIKCDDPLVYDEPWVGQTAAVGVSLYNMGKSSIYNCMVTVEGEGLSMPETYFGGNIASGGTMRAEFDVLTEVAGDIEGSVIITYEDVYGEQMEERLPLSLYVNEQMILEPVMPEDGMYEPAVDDMAAMPAMGDESSVASVGGIPWYLWAIAIVALIAAIVVLGIKRRQRRIKELEAL